MHSRTGSVGSTDMHGREAPCVCELPANAPADMPPECQAAMLKEQWCLEFGNLSGDGRAASKSRYEPAHDANWFLLVFGHFLGL